MSTIPDSLEKQAILDAPLARAWRAISEAKRFGDWFGAAFDGEFAPGAQLVGRIVPTRMDPEIARKQAPHAGMRFAFAIERIEPPSLLVFRWHPLDADEHGERNPATRVEFRLEPLGDRTRLTIVESGFSAVPLARRAALFERNQDGWEAQLGLIARYLGQDD